MRAKRVRGKVKKTANMLTDVAQDDRFGAGDRRCKNRNSPKERISAPAAPQPYAHTAENSCVEVVRLGFTDSRRRARLKLIGL